MKKYGEEIVEEVRVLYEADGLSLRAISDLREGMPSTTTMRKWVTAEGWVKGNGEKLTEAKRADLDRKRIDFKQMAVEKRIKRIANNSVLLSATSSRFGEMLKLLDPAAAAKDPKMFTALTNAYKVFSDTAILAEGGVTESVQVDVNERQFETPEEAMEYFGKDLVQGAASLLEQRQRALNETKDG